MNLTKLTEFNFQIHVDASGSMADTDTPTRQTRYEYVNETAFAFASELAKLDDDGIDLVFFGGMQITSQTGVQADAIKTAFASRYPTGSTPLAESLQRGFDIAAKSNKKTFIVVFTDGVPNDQTAAAQAIVNQSHKQATDDQLTILFIQVGHDKAASAYLRKLDDELTTAKFDIVDAKTIEEVEKYSSITDLIIHAIAD